MDGCTPAYIRCIAVENKPVVTISSSQGHDCMAALRRAFDASLSRISQLFCTSYDLKFSRLRLYGCTPACIRCIAVEDKPVVFHFRTISQGHDKMAALQCTFDVSLSRISQLLYTSYDMSIDSIVIFIVLRLVYRWIFMVYSTTVSNACLVVFPSL